MPLIDGIAKAGISEEGARADHTHPSGYTQSLNTNGWCDFPNGLQIRWGLWSTGSGAVIVTFLRYLQITV